MQIKSNFLRVKTLIIRFFQIIYLKYKHKGLMSFRQYWHIAREIEIIRPANILIFGLGFDSLLWNKLNKNGKTIFIEDNKDWIDKFKYKDLLIKKVSYKTEIKRYREYGIDSEFLLLKLSKEIFQTKWDLIFVDGPLGHQPPRKWAGPGRMSSLYTAKKLSKFAKCIIVDDFARKIENEYSLYYFGKKNLYKVIEKKLAFFKKSRF